MRLETALLLGALSALSQDSAVRRPVIPQHPRIFNPVDAFVLTHNAATGKLPYVNAAPEVLVRRAYLDLTGLPPTASQVVHFIQETSAAAWPRLIDELLDTPRCRARQGADGGTPQAMANRLWKQHFGREVEDPELLNFLAWQYLEYGKSIPKMHKLIMTSETYREATWPTRTPRRPLTEEELRDSIEFVTEGGRLGSRLAARYPDDQDLLRQAYRSILAREPRMEEFNPALRALRADLESHRDRAEAVTEFCRKLLNRDDFRYCE